MMKASLTLLLILLSIQSGWTQDTLPVYQEPFHHLVFENSEIRILDVRLQPGDTSDWHRHHDAITYIGLEGSRIWLDVPGEHSRSVYLPDDFWGGDTDYPETSFVHRIANVGFQPFRLLAVEHLSLRQDVLFSESEMSDWESLDINPYFLLFRKMMEPGISVDQMLRGPGILFCRGKGNLLIQSSEGTISLDHGCWTTWPLGNQKVTLSNTSLAPMEVLLLQH